MKNYPLLHPLEGISRSIRGERMGYYLIGSVLLDVVAMILSTDPFLYYTMGAIAILTMVFLALNHIGAAFEVDDDDFEVNRSDGHAICMAVQYYSNWACLFVVILLFGTAVVDSGLFGVLLWTVALNNVALLFRLTCELDKITESHQ